MKRLVVNGCSYTDWYAQGRGHFDLAQRLNIQQAESLTLPGACNTRILRERYNWNGLQMDGSNENLEINLRKEWTN